jgi:geranylgeranylglycerol-phosphate geranylgeranyltransferase
MRTLKSMKEIWILARVEDLIRITRPVNLLITAIAIWIGWGVASGDPFSFTVSLPMIILSGILLTAGGNIFNDIDDVEIDRRIHPERPIASGDLKISQMHLTATILWFISFLLTAVSAFIEKTITPLIVIIFASILLISYDAWSKKKGLAGNITVSFLTGIPFIFGASLTGDIPLLIIVFSILAALINFSREIIKDIDDVQGDSERRNPFPMTHGTRTSILLCRLSTVCGIFASFAVILIFQFNLIYLVIILIADMLFILSMVSPESYLKRSSMMLKQGMFIALIAFFSFGFY